MTSSSTTRDSSKTRDEIDVEKGEIISSQPSKPQFSLARHFNAEVSASGVDILILLCWFTTGFLDSTIFNGKSIPSLSDLPS